MNRTPGAIPADSSYSIVGYARIDRAFWVGLYDFPMVNSMRLSHDERVSVVLTRWEQEAAELMVLYFPASYASVREKFYEDEAVEQLLGVLQGGAARVRLRRSASSRGPRPHAHAGPRARGAASGGLL